MREWNKFCANMPSYLAKTGQTFSLAVLIVGQLQGGFASWPPPGALPRIKALPLGPAGGSATRPPL